MRGLWTAPVISVSLTSLIAAAGLALVFGIDNPKYGFALLAFAAIVSLGHIAQYVAAIAVAQGERSARDSVRGPSRQ